MTYESMIVETIKMGQTADGKDVLQIPFDKSTLLILLIELPRCIKLFALDLE